MRRGGRELFGSPQALSLRAWAAVTPVGVIAAPLAAYPAAAGLGEGMHWLLIGLLAQAPMGIVMLIGGWLVRRVPWPRLLTCGAVLVAGAARGLTIALVGHAPDVATRTLSSSVTMAIWLLVIGAALDSHERYRREVDELLARLVAHELHGRLLDDGETRAARVASADRLAETSHELRTIVGGAAEDHARTAALLQAAIETRLRPLSHDLWFSPRPLPPQAHRRRVMLARIATADVPVLPLFLSAIVLLPWGSVVLHGAWRSAIVGVSVAVAYGCMLVIARRLRGRPRAAAIIRYLGIFLLPAAAGGAAIAILGLGHRLSPIAVALGLPMITLGVAAAITLSADRARTIAELRARLAEPDWDRHLGDLVRREVDESTATMLHNSVQPVLMAAALQLQLAAALNEPERARDALDRALRAIDEAEAPDAGATTGRLRLEQAGDAWQGIADVDLHLPDAEVEAAEWNLLADVIHESIANAVRHGRATAIRVDIAVSPVAVTVTFTDNGTAPGTAGMPGLGATWLASVTRSTEVFIQPDGRRASHLVFPRAALPSD